MELPFLSMVGLWVIAVVLVVDGCLFFAWVMAPISGTQATL